MRASTVVVNISPLGFHRYASDFLAAADGVTPRKGFSPVPYYLVCRALELGLKAFLLAKRYDKGRLRGALGHDLIRCLSAANSLGLEEACSISDEQVREIRKANAYYKSKGFEYFEAVKAFTGYRDLPDIEVLKGLARGLLDGSEPICLSA